ncbi:MAG: hypothetical protein U0232_01730 [Thermomicrobiales bacterium]
MGSEPNYYQTLGVEPTADQAAIEAAYQGKALRFRLGQLRDRARTLPGPSQEEIEQAFAVLGNPEARALYDAAYFPEKATARRRLPVWLWGVAAAWVAVIAIVIVLGARSRLVGDGGPIGQLVGTATATAVPSVVAAVPPTETATLAATAAPPTNTAVAVVAPSSAPTPTIPAAPTDTPTPATPSLTFRPTATEPPSPTATIANGNARADRHACADRHAVPPTATPVPPPPTEAPPTEAPPPEPTPTPSFRATDRIAVTVQVNLRAGPGTNFATVGPALAPGTLLAATGESANAGGYLWRRFEVADGRFGWVRDVDVLPVR